MSRKIIIFFSLLLLSSCASLSEPGRIYKNALNNVKEKNFDSAFMNLRELARDYPNSPYSRNARFAMAEYLFTKKDYYDSLREFVSIIEDFPNTSQALFAKAIVYKALSEFSSKEIEGLSSKIKREFFAQPIILVFSEYKTKSLKTLLGSHYTIKDYVDRVEIFKDNEIFLKITP